MTKHADEKVTLGFWVYLMSDCVLFAGLFASYAVLVGATAGGPEAIDIFNLPGVLIQTLLLLTSSFTSGIALLMAHRHNKAGVLWALFATLLLGLSFLGLEVMEFRQLVLEGAGPDRSAFLSAFFALVGTHGLHIAFGSLWMIVLMVQVALRGIPETITRLACLALFWHFLDIVWICIFTFVYLMGIV